MPESSETLYLLTDALLAVHDVDRYNVRADFYEKITGVVQLIDELIDAKIKEDKNA